MTNAPAILDQNPAPIHKTHSFHGRPLMVWEGYADPTKVSGWVSNPRLELELKRFKNKFAGREPDQDEILKLMLADKEFDLKKLAEDIRKNGVQMPLILSASGKLLDGNRRFFAVKHLLNITSEQDPTLQIFKRVPVIVLDENASPDDEHHVLVQTNFYDTLKKPWPAMVLATHVYNALQEGATAAAVSQRFEWTVAKVNDTKKIMGLIYEFISWAIEDAPDGLGLDELDAEAIAAEKYQQFNEAQKSFYQALLNDVEFKVQFFRWVAEDKFKNFQEVRVARVAWEDPELRNILLSNSPEAAEHARAAVAYKKVSANGVQKVSEQIENFTKFLRKLTAQEISGLKPNAMTDLEEILRKVVVMAASSANDSNQDNDHS